MSETVNPRQVPLPDVPEHTDHIAIDGLALPQGFDDERLLVNVWALEKYRSINMIGDLTIRGVDGDTSGYDITMGGLTGHGLGLAAASRKASHEPLATAAPGFQHAGDPVTLRVNNTERNQRIRHDDKANGLMDARAQAYYLDQSIRSGLRTNTIQTNLKSPWDIGLFTIADIYSPLSDVFQHHFGVPFAVGGSLAIGKLYDAISMLGRHARQGVPVAQAVREERSLYRSLFARIPVERIALGGLLINSSKLVRARK